MKMHLSLENDVTVITKNETPYNVDGNSGITYRLVIMQENDVEKVKCVDKTVYDRIQCGKNYILTGELNINNARVSEWKVNGFKLPDTPNK